MSRDPKVPANERSPGTTPFPDNRVADTGRFMCHHNVAEPPVERSDQPSPVDMKQDAVLAVLRARRRSGRSGCSGCEEAINEDAGLAWRAYVRARVNFYRAKRGMGKRPMRQVSIDAQGIDLPEQGEGPRREQVESLAIVRQIVRDRAPALSERQVQRVIVLMWEAQAIKGKRQAVMPDDLRAAISRLRRATGLPLDTGLL